MIYTAGGSRSLAASSPREPLTTFLGITCQTTLLTYPQFTGFALVVRRAVFVERNLGSYQPILGAGSLVMKPTKYKPFS
jgi:hypothetical protein